MIRTHIFKMFSTHSKICIVGGGTAGLNLSAHFLRQGFKGSDMRIFEPSDIHYYQPGWTMLGAGLCGPDLTFRKTRDVIPSSVPITKQAVTKIDAENNTIITQDGEKHTYDQLIVGTGIINDWEKIPGAQEAIENPNSNVGSIYDIRYAEKMRDVGNRFKGGNAIFTEPPPPIKCGGAPQKIMYLWTDKWRRAGIPANVEFVNSRAVMFGVPKYSESLEKVAKDFNIDVTFNHKLVEVKGETAVFQHVQTGDKIEKHFDFLHIIPPLKPHAYIKESGLGDENGYLTISKLTLQHDKYKNIWGIGDCTNTPNSKTAAAVFSQTETLVRNVATYMRDPTAVLPEEYMGYSSCPLFVGNGKLMLAEFRYGGIVDETFFKNQEKPRRFFYYVKKFGFPIIYWHLVPRGLWGGRKGLYIDI